MTDVTNMADKKTLIITALDTMRQGDLIRGEKFSALAYAKVIKALKGMPGPVTTVANVDGIKGIGPKIKLKIEEILTTGSLQSAERTKKELKMDIYDALLKVHGVGPVKAKELVTAGITSIENLRSRQDLLNDVQRMGLKYYESILERIPRQEMMQHEILLKAALPPQAEGIIVGSYRRQAESSGDIDMLLGFDPNLAMARQKGQFTSFINDLVEKKYILDILALGQKKCMAVVALPGGAMRRLDLLFTPRDEFAYSILYFTGSDAFNVAFRSHALSRGYTMNEHMMRIRAKFPSLETPHPPIMENEEAIFTFLGLQYVAPENRKGEESLVKV